MQSQGKHSSMHLASALFCVIDYIVGTRNCAPTA
jgi:hypothetical protein